VWRGADHSLFLKADGSLWGMGYNSYGQLGDGTTNNTILPEMLVQSNVVANAAGSYHSLKPGVRTEFLHSIANRSRSALTEFWRAQLHS
jgi:alpha-tubulin suppressor-like RCC1 family protein